MSYKLGGERSHTVAAAAPSPSSTDQRTCTMRRMLLVSVILAVQLVLAEAEESPPALESLPNEEFPPALDSPPGFTTLPSTATRISFTTWLPLIRGVRVKRDLRAPEISRYSFHIKQTTIRKGGATYTVNTINGTINGPAIHVRNGTWLSINVTNGLTESDSGLSIHWHGLDMRGAQVFDGVVGLTQCPIAPGKSYLYNWKVNEQPGTYWYHTHDRVAFPHKEVDFIRGPLIIHESDANIPESASQDSYHMYKERILFYQPTLEGDSGKTVSDMSIEGNNISSGHAAWKSGLLNGDEQPVFEVENGEHRFRIINGGESAYFFSVGEYKLTVVATDSYPVEPYETDVIQIAIAERYDVKINFNITTPTKNVWIRALTPSEGQDKGIFGVLRIRQNPHLLFDPKNPQKAEKRVNMTAVKILNCEYFEKPEYDCHPVTELVSTTKRKLLGSFEYHTADILAGEHFFVSIDGSPFTKNVIPCNAAIMASAKKEWSLNTNILNLPTRKSVTIVIRNRCFMNHPMHLHGHHFEVLEIALRKTADCGKNNLCPLLDLQTAFSEPIEQLMKRPRQGVLKDTVILPPGGAVAVRINSDNPGVWYFHCHIHPHLLDGLTFALNEGCYLFSRTNGFPKDYPSCSTCDCIDKDTGVKVKCTYECD